MPAKDDMLSSTHSQIQNLHNTINPQKSKHNENLHPIRNQITMFHVPENQHPFLSNQVLERTLALKFEIALIRSSAMIELLEETQLPLDDFAIEYLKGVNSVSSVDQSM